MGVLSFEGIIILFFCHNYITEFVKNADSIYVIVVTPFSRKVSLATIGVCVFSAVYFGSRTFCFLEVIAYGRLKFTIDYKNIFTF